MVKCNKFIIIYDWIWVRKKEGYRWGRDGGWLIRFILIYKINVIN